MSVYNGEEAGCWGIQFISINLVMMPAIKMFSHQNRVGEEKRISKMPGCLSPVRPNWTSRKMVCVPVEI